MSASISWSDVSDPRSWSVTPAFTFGVRVDSRPWIPPGYIIALDSKGNVAAVIRTGEGQP